MVHSYVLLLTLCAGFLYSERNPFIFFWSFDIKGMCFKDVFRFSEKKKNAGMIIFLIFIFAVVGMDSHILGKCFTT
jgi:hypothetical protein